MPGDVGLCLLWPKGASRKCNPGPPADGIPDATGIMKKSKKNGDNESQDSPAPNGKLKWKEYQRELAKLHVELVKLQEWVVHKGLKVCVVFEGRDGAGKGGVIKAITERVSPRVYRVVALPAPTE